MKLILLIILIGSLDSVKPAEEKPQIYCGRLLVNMRMLLCYENMQKELKNNPTVETTSDSGKDQNTWPTTSTEKNLALAIAMQGKSNAALINECCYKPCYINELLSYC